MSTVLPIRKIDIEHALACVGTAVDAAVTLAGSAAPTMEELSRQAEACLQFASIYAWGALEETLDKMHTCRQQLATDEAAHGGQRSEVSKLIDDEIKVALHMLREGRRQWDEQQRAFGGNERRALGIDDEAGDR